MKIEIWKDIKEYEGYYQASTFGRIKSLDRYVENSINGTRGGVRFLRSRLLKLSKYPTENDPNDYYLGVMLCKDGTEKCFRVNRIIAETFIPNPKNLPEVNHLDRIKWNNRVENLEWSEPREQTTHRLMNAKKTSKYTGVSWRKENQKWVAQIQIKNKKMTLGCFNNEEDARNAYLEALKKNGLENKYATFS